MLEIPSAIVTQRSRRSRSMVRAWLSSTALVILASMTWGCDHDLSRNYEFIINVSSEPGRALAGAAASLRGKELGVSDSSGSVAIQVRGNEGDVLPIEVSCPPGHRPPSSALRIPLRQVGKGVKPEFTAVCTPLAHSVVVAVRAEHGPNLPLLYLGRELARTDASGAAHLVLDVATEDVVELVLDTSEQPRLRPKSPIIRVQTGSRDEITAVDQAFTLEPREVVKLAPPRRGPTRIN